MTGDPVADQADAVVGVLARALPAGTVVGAYLYGSAVAGGLRRDSDLDFFGVVNRRLTPAETRALSDGLIPISDRDSRPPSWRPIELTLAVHGEIRPWRYPPRVAFQYGEWLRGEFQRGDLAPWNDPNPDLAVLVTMVLASGVPRIGPPAGVLLAPVPPEDVSAMADELPSMLDDLESDTRNVLLTLARMWSTVTTGEVRTKDGAADWALIRLPEEHRQVLELARSSYLGKADDPAYDLRAVRSHAVLVVDQIRRASRR
ncbi:MAG TPA: aminoglycoside adenylyltransferase family protein [Candidatus Limnocylindria bacterium]